MNTFIFIIFWRGRKKHFHSGLFLTLVPIPSRRLPVAEQVQRVDFSANPFTIETLKKWLQLRFRAPTCTLQCISVLWHNRHKEQHSVTAPSYSCNQAGLCIRPGAQSVSSHKARGFYITALLSRIHFPWVGIVWLAYSAICLLRLHSPGGEGGNKGGQAWLLCLFVLHMSDGCNTNNATPAKRMQVINCWWRKKNSLSKRHHNPQWQKLPCEQVDYVNASCLCTPCAAISVVDCHSPSLGLPHAKQPCTSCRPGWTLICNHTPLPVINNVPLITAINQA